MMDFLTHFSTNFGPILFDIGAGISRTNSISSIASINETALTGSIDIGYSIIKQDDLDLILNLNLRYQHLDLNFQLIIQKIQHRN